MLHLECDYMRGAHPAIMQALAETNMEPCPGYGLDGHTETARHRILEACGLAPSEGEVFFLEGGTQTNMVVLDALLRPWEGVICADSGHISVHEAGAIESTGHKVIPLPSADGKMTADALDEYMTHFYADETYEHFAAPGAVYISQPTELGSLYTHAELKALAQVCRKYDLRLFADGARLLYALASPANDVSLSDLARECDAFYIGGTKAGLLFGEAVVTARPERFRHFFTQMKRHGALLAKGRVLGVQFERLFTDGLYRQIGENAVSAAFALKEGMRSLGYTILFDSPTNQQFFRMPVEIAERLGEYAGFSMWGPPEDGMADIRLVTDWSTTADDVTEFLEKAAEIIRQ